MWYITTIGNPNFVEWNHEKEKTIMERNVYDETFNYVEYFFLLLWNKIITIFNIENMEA